MCMADFIPSKKEATDFNNGVQYVGEDKAHGITGDIVKSATINNLVESALYSQETAETAKTIANAALDKINGALDNMDAPPPVGYHYIQYIGEPTPAQRWAGTTWSLDTTYTGKVLVGCGENYPFGSTGGSDTHRHDAGSLYGKLAFMTDSQKVMFDIVNTPEWTVSRGRKFEFERVTKNETNTEGLEISGSTDDEIIMPPYVVVNYWIRRV